MTFAEAKCITMTSMLPQELYIKFRQKIEQDDYSVNEAIESLIYNYVNDVYKRKP